MSMPSAAIKPISKGAAAGAILRRQERITRTVMAISYLGLVYAALGYANQTYFHWVDSFWLSTYSDKIAIITFGVWRVTREKNPYTRKRIAILSFFVATLWIVFPYVTGSNFFNNHLIGSFWFFAYLVVVFAFGRRADCSWNCPCVGLRDTAGNAFWQHTIKGAVSWKLRYLKWASLAVLLGYLFLFLALPQSYVTRQYIFLFWTFDQALYFASFLLVPWMGNRNFCRFLCPWGALYGIVGNKLGFYKIAVDRQKCIPCNICEAACDQGIPIKSFIQKYGELNPIDCVGCGRCITECPRGAMRFVDIRDYVGSLIGRRWRAESGAAAKTS
ncbi:MAG: 4Fe-4S binding protein [Chloroflexi bacterium]|nr:4Fe-4S binding protein [Chloroflexota bacterium]